MVKLDYDDFISRIDQFFTDSKDKGSIYFTFKRVYSENYKFKKNKRVRKLRKEDHFNQEADKDKQYNVLVRAKLNKKRVQTIIKPNEINSFHNILMKIFSLHFITSSDETVSKKLKANDFNKNKSKTLRRKDKKLKKLGKRKEENKVDITNNNTNNQNKESK